MTSLIQEEFGVGTAHAAGTWLEHSHPEKREEDKEKLLGLANRIRAWQEKQRPRLSDEAIVRRFPGLGSTKTYRRIREGDLEGLIAENHLARYNGVWNEIEVGSRHAAREEELYDDLTPAMDSGLAIAGAIPATGQARLVVIEGPTGAGKSACLALAARRFAGNAIKIEASEGWASLNAALGDILVAGRWAEKHDLPGGKAERLDLLLSCLAQGKPILLIDEAHHMTSGTLNVIKTLLNRTQAVIIIAGIDTLWRKLAAKSWEEAKQLLLNRLYERVRIGPPSETDGKMFLERRLGKDAFAPDWEKGLATACDAAAHGGYWSFFRRLHEALEGADEKITAQSLALKARQISAKLETHGKK